MQRILNDLFNDTIYEFSSSKRLRVARDEFKLLELQQKILDRLGEGGVELITEYDRKREENDQNQTAEAFIKGFRCGARLMAAVFDDEFE